MNLLLDEHPLLVMPGLATKIGLNESIILQQIHYWLQNKEKANQDFHDGHYWIYNTYEQWQEQFPFWSIMTIRRTITKLENAELLISGNYNRAGFDKTKWYTVNYTALNKIITSSSVQNEHMDCSNCTDGMVQNEQTNTIDYTENTTETNSRGSIGSNSVKHRNCPVSKSPSGTFDFDVVRRQLKAACKNLNCLKDYDEIVEVFRYFYESYLHLMGQNHPNLSNETIKDIVRRFYDDDEGFDYDVPDYKLMIDTYFHTDFDNCNYSIAHFMSGAIRKLRFYEECY